MTNSKKYLIQQKLLKARHNPKIFLNTHLSTFGEHTIHEVTKCKNKKYGVCNIIIEGISNNFENPKAKLKINRDFCSSSINVVYTIKCNKC